MAPTSNPVTPPPGPVAEPIGTQPSGQAAKEPAAPAMEESRRRHGEGLQRQGRKLGPPPPRPTRPRAPAATTGADASRQPSRETLTPEAHPVSRPLPGFEETATAPPPSQKDHPIATVVQLAFLGVFAFFFLSIVRSFPFGVSPFIIIVFAIVILGNLMRIVARAGGRKTTTMRQPGSRSGWKR